MMSGEEGRRGIQKVRALGKLQGFELGSHNQPSYLKPLERNNISYFTQ